MRASFRVEIAAPAEADLQAYHAFIARDKKTAAAKWLRDILAAIRSLRFFPYSHEEIPEGQELGLDCRHLLHGHYRVIYRVEERRVRVLRVLHAARSIRPEMFQAERS